MSKTLILVESGHKSKVISGFLDSSYIVKATAGHVRELIDPKKIPETKKAEYYPYSVSVKKWDALYRVDPSHAKIVKDIKDALSKVDSLVLATDDDREGEAIAWHILEIFASDIKRNKIKVSRAVWHEITKKAIDEGLKNQRQVDGNIVDAALARSYYDRVFGFSISPVLWRVIAPGTSGGRVQSPALRLVVDREKERLAFVSANFMSISASFDVDKSEIIGLLTAFGGKTIATGASFDSKGKLKDNELVITEELSEKLSKYLKGLNYKVSDVSTKPYSRKPPAPYTTSAFQQDVGTRLRISSKQSMSIAQKLYDSGFTTYPRVDSPALSEEATKAARDEAIKLFGSNSVPSSPRIYKSKGSAQNAHEAIRPTTDSNGKFLSPKTLKTKLDALDKSAFKVYEAIYNRTVASQMNDAKGTTTTVKIQSVNTEQKKTALFSSSATNITEPGWTALTKPVETDDEGNEVTLISKIPKVDDPAKIKKVSVKEHKTTPPARYTEPSLVKKLETLDIGRPATYATIVSVNQTRGYVKKKGQQLYPTWVGFKVAQYLEAKIPNFVSYDSTADMESELDKIESGKLQKNRFLDIEWKKIQKDVLPLGSTIDWNEVNTVGTIDLNNGYVVRVNKFGSFLEDTNSPLNNKGFRDGYRLDDEENVSEMDFSDVEVCKNLMKNAKTVRTSNELGMLSSGVYKDWVVTVREGKYGAYLQAVNPNDSKAKPVNQKLPEGLSIDEVTLENSEKLFAEVKLPRNLSDNFFVGQSKKGNWLGYKKTAKTRKATFISLPEDFDPRTVSLEEVEKIWKESDKES